MNSVTVLLRLPVYYTDFVQLTIGMPKLRFFNSSDDCLTPSTTFMPSTKSSGMIFIWTTKSAPELWKVQLFIMALL